MGLKILKKISKGLDKHIFSKVDKAIEKVGTNIGEFLNDVTGVTSSARQQYEYNNQLQQNAQDFNAQEAQKARDWETEMSNTARQRGTADLQQAGLNPVLSAGEGAWAGAGAQATSPGGSTGAGIGGGNPISMITDLINASNNTAKTNADVTNQTNIVNSEIVKNNAEVLRIAKENGYTDEKIKNAIEERNLIVEQIEKAKSETDLLKAEAKLKGWNADHPYLMNLVFPMATAVAGGLAGGVSGGLIGGLMGGINSARQHKYKMAEKSLQLNSGGIDPKSLGIGL